MRVEPVRAGQGEGLGHGFDGGGQGEVARELGQVGQVRLLAHRPDLPADGVEQRTHAVQGLGIASGQDVEAPGRRHVGTAEHRRRHIADPRLLVGAGELLGEGHRDGGAHHVDQARTRRGEGPGGQDHLTDRLVGGEHGEHRLGVEGVGRRPDRLGARRAQGLGGPRRAVPDLQPMTGLQQVGRHARAHVAQADEAHVHVARS